MGPQGDSGPAPASLRGAGELRPINPSSKLQELESFPGPRGCRNVGQRAGRLARGPGSQGTPTPSSLPPPGIPGTSACRVEWADSPMSPWVRQASGERVCLGGPGCAEGCGAQIWCRLSPHPPQVWKFPRGKAMAKDEEEVLVEQEPVWTGVGCGLGVCDPRCPRGGGTACSTCDVCMCAAGGP